MVSLQHQSSKSSSLDSLSNRFGIKIELKDTNTDTNTIKGYKHRYKYKYSYKHRYKIRSPPKKYSTDSFLQGSGYLPSLLSWIVLHTEIIFRNTKYQIGKLLRARRLLQGQISSHTGRAIFLPYSVGFISPFSHPHLSSEWLPCCRAGSALPPGLGYLQCFTAPGLQLRLPTFS